MKSNTSTHNDGSTATSKPESVGGWYIEIFLAAMAGAGALHFNVAAAVQGSLLHSLLSGAFTGTLLVLGSIARNWATGKIATRRAENNKKVDV